MKGNAYAARTIIVMAVFQLILYFGTAIGYIIYVDEPVFLKELFEKLFEVTKTIGLIRPCFSLFFAYALIKFDKPTKRGYPYVLKPLLFWVVLTISISQVVMAVFVLANILPPNRYINTSLIREKINRWWAIVGGFGIVIVVVLLIVSIAQLSTEEKSLIYLLAPRLVTLIPDFLLSITQLLLCKWVTTDPYGLYTQPEQPRTRSEDSIFRD